MEKLDEIGLKYNYKINVGRARPAIKQTLKTQMCHTLVVPQHWTKKQKR